MPEPSSECLRFKKRSGTIDAVLDGAEYDMLLWNFGETLSLPGLAQGLQMLPESFEQGCSGSTLGIWPLAPFQPRSSFVCRGVELEIMLENRCL